MARIAREEPTVRLSEWCASAPARSSLEGVVLRGTDEAAERIGALRQGVITALDARPLADDAPPAGDRTAVTTG